MPQIINITRTLYEFDELSDKAKETARDWWRAGLNEDWDVDHMYDDFIAVAQCMGIEISTHPRRTYGGSTITEPNIWWSGFWNQGDGLCFEGDYHRTFGPESALDRISGHAPRDNELLRIASEIDAVEAAFELQAAYGHDLAATIKQRGQYYSPDIEVYDMDDQYAELDADIVKPLIQALRDLMHWMYRELQKAYEYDNSDECIDENLRANEYTFTEAGKRIDADDL